jgi:predicted ATPase
MFLRRLRLTNIRSIAALDMSFETPEGTARPWTFLLGENGAGKSTILRCIALALAGGEALPKVLGDHDWWIRSGQDKASIDVEIATVEGARRSARLSFKRGDGIRQLLANNKKTLEQLDAALVHSLRNYFVVGYGVARRPATTELSSPSSVPSTLFRHDRAQNIATLFSSAASLVSLEQWAMDLDYRRGAGGLKVVRGALDTLLPDVRFEGVDKTQRKLRFRTPDGTLPLELLSDGYQAMAAWCGDLLFRITETFANYPSALKARGLLLIDELDLHLHPVWQRQLVSFLKATLPNFQIVTTTHSPLTVHQAGEGELFVLKRASANAPAAISQFQGAPNQLMLHQLIQSPIFGLETLDSPQVAEMRDELRSLRGLPSRGRALSASPKVASKRKQPRHPTARKRRIKQLESDLSSATDWKSVPDYLQPTNKLLEQIAVELSGSVTDGPGAVKRLTKATARRSSAAGSKKKKK